MKHLFIESTEFRSRLVAWYQRHARKLPWREATDPYRILVSEFMLQQTQVATVLGYYKRWLDRFPTIRDWLRLTRVRCCKSGRGSAIITELEIYFSARRSLLAAFLNSLHRPLRN